MRSIVSTPFIAVFQNEVRFNLKRAAPYALALIFSANAVMWWGWGPAGARGWAVNSDFFIIWLLRAFSFLTGLPLFIALMMADPVARDFRIGVDPLIFSKPLGRAEYLLGKFFGNFLVLVCCQSCFALTALALQAVRRPGMIVLAPRMLPYLQHFFFFIVVSSLALAALCFTLGTLTRNVKVVYGLVFSLYFLYIAWQETIKGWPLRWRIILDPLLFNSGEAYQGSDADRLNHLTVSYDGAMIINRVLMLCFASLCLAILHLRFSSIERARAGGGSRQQPTLLNLAPETEALYQEEVSYRETETLAPPPSIQTEAERRAGPRQAASLAGKGAALPQGRVITGGWRAGLEQFAAAMGVEFRLLRAERSLVVVAPLMLMLCNLELAAYRVSPVAGSYSAAYASGTANSLLLFLFGIAVFYTGEALHRDRESGIEPMLWSTPVSNFVMLLSKFAATLLLSVSLIALVAATAVLLQLYKGHAPLELQAYLSTYALISVPGVVFMIAAAVASNILLRDKYLAYAVSIAAGGAFFYLTSQGYNHWLYNPVLYHLWTPADLATGSPHLKRILIHRVYCLALSALLLALSLLLFERKTTKGLKARGRLSGKGWAVLALTVSALAALLAGLSVNNAE